MMNLEATFIRILILLFAISVANVVVVYVTLSLAMPKKKEEKYNPIRHNYLLLKEHKDIKPVNKMSYMEFKKYERELKREGIL